MAFAQPLFALPDEPVHWYTAHARAEKLLGAEKCVPAVEAAGCPRRGRCSAIPQLQMSCTDELPIYGGLLTYPGVLLSKLILTRQTESPTRQIQAIMLSRLLQGLLVVLCLLRAGVVVLRAGRQGLLVLGAFLLSPLVAQQVFAVSSDGAGIAFGVCLFTAVVAFRELSWLDLALLLLFGVCSAGKPTLLPVILPALLAGQWLTIVELPGEPRLGESLRELARGWKWSRRPSIQTLTLWAGLFVSLLTVFSSLHHDEVATAMGPPSEARQTNGSALLDDPMLLLRLASTMRYDPRNADVWVGPLGWLNVKMAAAVVNRFLLIALVMALIELVVWGLRLRRQPVPLKAAGRYLLRALPPFFVGVAGVLANFLFMTAIMYMLWTEAGAQYVAGVQFRYFIPAVMVAIALVFRTLSGVSVAGEAKADCALPRSGRAKRLSFAAGLVAHGLVLSLSLPYVARVFVDLSTHYSHPRHSR